MKITIVAALDPNRVIGRDGHLPWHLPEDLAHFKSITMGHTLLMGRKTFESIGRSLPGRRTIVLTSHLLPNIECFPSISEALRSCAENEEVFVAGGESIFRQMLTMADEWVLTHLHDCYSGDTYFPEYAHLVGTQYECAGTTVFDQFDIRTYRRFTAP